MIYLGGPYNDPQHWVIENRMRYIERAVAYFNSRKQWCISPLLLHHCMGTGIKLPTDFKFWQQYCHEIWLRCDEMVILQVAGWDSSAGVAAEIAWAKRDKKPLLMKDPNDLYPTTYSPKSKTLLADRI